MFIEEIEEINEINYRKSLARIYGPKDILTNIAKFLVKAVISITVILFPLQIITTGCGCCLVGCTFGLLSIALSIIWWPFFTFLIGTSWLWLHAWYLRPVLLLPGVVVAFIAILIIKLIPEPEMGAKNMKLSIAGEWPLSWYLVKPPDQYVEISQDN